MVYLRDEVLKMNEKRGISVGQHQLMKTLNRAIILKIIRKRGPMSRAEIEKITGLGNTTIANFVGDLVAERLVVEASFGVSRGGRKPVLLEINSGAGFAVGVELGMTLVKAVVVDLKGQIIARDARPTKVEQGRAAVVMEQLIGNIQKVMEDSGCPKDRIRGIGLGITGILDQGSGVSISFPRLMDWRDVPIKGLLEETFEVPVYIYGNTHAAALGEKWFGSGDGVRDLLYINIGTGISLGIIIDGSIYQGISDTAGEIGHLTIDKNGPLCYCGNRGCLEVLASGSAMVSQVKEALERGVESNISRLVDGDMDKITTQTVFEAAEKGDILALNVVEQCGGYLGIAIANAVNLFNPEMIVIGGNMAYGQPLLLNVIERTIKRRAIERANKTVRIAFTRLGYDVGPLGATALVLREVFKIPQVALPAYLL